MPPNKVMCVFCLKDAAIESLTTVRPYSNEIHAQAQLWLKKDPKASYEAWKKCLPARCKYRVWTVYIIWVSQVYSFIVFNEIGALKLLIVVYRRSGNDVKTSGEGWVTETVSTWEVCVEVETVHEV